MPGDAEGSSSSPPPSSSGSSDWDSGGDDDDDAAGPRLSPAVFVQRVSRSFGVLLGVWPPPRFLLERRGRAAGVVAGSYRRPVVLVCFADGPALSWRESEGLSELARTERGTAVCVGGPRAATVVTGFADGSFEERSLEPGGGAARRSAPLPGLAPVRALAVSACGRAVACAYEGDRTARLWSSGAVASELRHRAPVMSVAAGADRRGAAHPPVLASGGEDKTARAAPSALLSGTKRFNHAHRVNLVRLSPDGRALATACHDGRVRLFRATARGAAWRAECSFRTVTNADWVESLAFTPDGAHLVALETDLVAIRRLGGGASPPPIVARLDAPDAHAACLCPRGRHVIVAGPGYVATWDWRAEPGRARAARALLVAGPLPDVLADIVARYVGVGFRIQP